MILFKKPVQLFAWLNRRRSGHATIGFVPTMGALHAGHLSLVAASRHDNALTVVSIFINPAQFNDAKDFARYPVTLEKDIALLAEAGCDVLFLPDVDDMYPEGTDKLERYALGAIETMLEGKFRPGHFQGVCAVMHRLLNFVQATNLYMGEKDYQQCMVVKKLLQLIQSNTVLHRCPTLREPDGLAMSSRNLRLNAGERQRATAVVQALRYLRENIVPGRLDALVAKGNDLLVQRAFRPDYVTVASAETLEPLTEWDGREKIIGLVAAWQHDVRLIDNMLLN